MRNITIAAILAMAALPGAAASRDVRTDAVEARAVDAAHNDSTFYVTIDLDLSGYKGMNSNRDVTITPLIAGAADTLALPPLMVAGRNRYYLHKRERAKDVTLLRAGKDAGYTYSATVEYLPWMENARIELSAQSCGCTGEPKDAETFPVAECDFTRPEYQAELLFIQPPVELEKRRELKGSAYIDFPVNRTELYPDYRRNPAELARINATIDSVRLDKDVEMNHISIKGFASPEGSWSNNVRLAKGRTATLKDYVLSQYDFNPALISTSFEPEDWEGLRRYVAASGMSDRDGILAIIDSTLAPDPKNSEIQKRYPAAYDFLLKEVYPGLRHSDYVIDYTVRQFTDVEEIKELIFTAPQKLSLSEMFAAAASMDPASAEYGEAFETAVRMYPSSEEANLNAGNAALRRGDLESATRYLARAGESPEAQYARGSLAARKGEYAEARRLLQKAAGSGISAASAALESLTILENFDGKSIRMLSR